VDKIRLEILGLSSSSQSQSGSFALVLGETGTNRRLPIIIGMFEAQAIAIEMEKITSTRPMTHDLFKSFAEAFSFKVTEILISDLREGVFYAKIVCTRGRSGDPVEIDARPSDAIAIGLRFGVPIFTNDSVMSEAAITITDTEDQAPTTPRREKASSKPPSNSNKSVNLQEGSLKSYSAEQLEEMLNEAVAEENYEKAAKIRDELDQRK
jgi:uncharacterized protein